MMQAVTGISGQTQAFRLGNLYIELLKHSITPSGEQALTFFWTYERMIHAEVMTHRWSRNYSSSRAIPYDKMMEWVAEDPANHAHLGSNKSGMQAGAEVEMPMALRQRIRAKFQEMREWCDEIATIWNPHKEVLNRYTEPWGWITGMATMGHRQFFNWINLRCTAQANANIQRVAINTLRLWKSSEPQLLRPGQWHTPWYDDYIPMSDKEDGEWVLPIYDPSVQVPLIWSGARSAWCSYNNPTKDATYEKAMKRHNDCVEFKHATPLEHQLRARADGGKLGLVPGYDSYRMMIPGESASSVDVDAILAAYEGKDYLVA